MYNRATSQRLLYTLFILQSLYTAAQIAVFTLMAIVTVRITGTESISGLPSSTVTFAQALFALPIALIMGRFGRRLGLTLGYVIGAAGGLLGILAITQGIFPLLLVSAACLGMGRASAEQSRFAAGEMFPENERAQKIGRVVFAGTIGAILGPVIVSPSGQLMATLGYSADTGPWLGALVFCALGAIIAFLFLRPDPATVARALDGEEKSKRKHDDPPKPARSLKTLLMLPTVQLAVAAALVSQTVMVVLMVMTPLHMDHNHHGREAISLVIAMHTLGMFGLSPLTGYLIDRYGRYTMLYAAAMTLIAAAVIAPVSTSQYVLAVALFLLGLGWNFGYVTGSSLLADALQGEERARVQGINDALTMLAAGFGSLGAGALFASAGYGAISLAGLALTLVLVFLIFLLNRPHPKVKVVDTGEQVREGRV